MDILPFAFLGFLLYIVVFLAVKHGINYSELGILIKQKKELEKEINKQD